MNIEGLLAELQSLWPALVNYLNAMMQPWRLIQIGMMLGFLGIGWLAARRLGPRMDAWMASETLPPPRARFLLLVRNRLTLLIFCALAWASVAIMREITWPSRSYFISLAASVATAWLVVSVVSRLIRNPLLRRIFSWGAWIYVTLLLLGLLPTAITMLDGIAISFGDVRISLLIVIKAVLTLGALMALASWLSSELGRWISRAEDLSPSLRVLADKTITILLFGAAIVLGMQAAGFDLTTLTVLSGAIGLGLGFGLQKVVSNLVSGVILLLDKSIKPGDVISLGETFGWISSLGARYVSVVTRDGREYLIPNEDLITGQVVNWSHSSDLVRIDLHFGVSYDADPHEVRRIAREAAASAARVVAEPKPVCHITGFGDFSVDLVLRFWIRDPTSGVTNVRGDVYLALWDALKAARVEIPFPRRDVTILNPAPSPMATPPEV